jgi:glycosyltransferase involved in cell wall biosynthesis
MTRPLRIAQVAPPLERVPPHAYGGTERIVAELVGELVDRGHEVTTFASGDSDVPGRLVPTVPRALRSAGVNGDPSPWFLQTVLAVLERAAEFDVIHSHIEWYSAIIASVAPVPVLTTWHGRLDYPWARDMLLAGQAHQVAISRAHAATHPDVRWSAIIHNGLDLSAAPFERRRGDALCFVGRIAPEKGIVEAIEIAKRAGRPLRVAAKEPYLPSERAYHESAFLPALRSMGSDAEYLGELSGPDRDRLFAESFATLMPGSWPEPFGLVAIESLACGTPILARRVGALPEIVRDGDDGYFGDDVEQLAFHVRHVERLDRAAIRRSVLERFSARRMADDYEGLYRRLVGVGEAVGPGRPGARERDASTRAARRPAVARSRGLSAVRFDVLPPAERPWTPDRLSRSTRSASSVQEPGPNGGRPDLGEPDATTGTRRGS